MPGRCDVNSTSLSLLRPHPWLHPLLGLSDPTGVYLLLISHCRIHMVLACGGLSGSFSLRCAIPIASRAGQTWDIPSSVPVWLSVGIPIFESRRAQYRQLGQTSQISPVVLTGEFARSIATRGFCNSGVRKQPELRVVVEERRPDPPFEY